jgi:hypothetical protein
MAKNYLSEFELCPAAWTEGAIDLMVVECHNLAASSSSSSTHHTDGFRAVTILANLSSDSEARSAFHLLRSALSFSRTTMHTIPTGSCAELIRARFVEHRLDFAIAVIFADTSVTTETIALQQLIDAMRQGVGTDSLPLLVVTGNAKPWRAIRGVSGYVHGVGSTGAGTAAIMFLMAASLMAPRTLSCMDFEDLGFIADSTDAAAILVEASWLKESNKLVWASDQDLAVVASSASVAALPLLGPASLAEVRQVANAVRAVQRSGAHFVYAAPDGLDPCAYLHSRIGMVPLLCQRQSQQP